MTGRVVSLDEASRTPAQKVAAGILAAMLLCALPAMFSTHLPTELGIRLAQTAGAVAAVLAAWESRDGGLYDTPGTRRGSWLTAHPITRVPLMALFAFLMTFTTVEDGVLALATAVIGKPGDRNLTVTGVSRPRKQCDHFNVAEVGWLLNRALCAPEEDLARAEGGGELTVFGKSSPFGLNVERYEVRSTPGPADNADGGW